MAANNHPKVDDKFRRQTKQVDMPPRLLLGPGPANVHPRVLNAQAMPLVGHLDPSFVEMMNETQDLMRYAFQTSNPITFPVSGCGSAAMEATFANSIEEGDVVLVAVAGYFGLRMVDMAGRYGADVRTINKPWGQNFTLAELEAAMDEHKPKVLGLVHADTSTGCRQPMEGVGEACRKRGALVIVDTVTSLAAEPVFVDTWGDCLVYSGGQKAVGLPPGSSPLTVSPRAMEIIGARKKPVANWYLDLNLITKYWGSASGGGGGRAYHHTAPISMTYAMREALRLIAEEGLEERWARHRRNAELLWAQLEEAGLELVVPAEHRLVALTTVKVPEGIDAKRVTAYLLEKYNIEIGNGLGEFAGKAWRIGLMGHNSRAENVKLVVAALLEAIAEQRKQ